MANTAQAKKRARQSEKRRQSNAGQRSLLRTRIKNVLKAIEAGDKSSAEVAYRLAIPVIDKMAGNRIIHGNKAARHKSRLSARIQKM